MAKYGKWIGGGLGWALGGPIEVFLDFSSVACSTICSRAALNMGKLKHLRDKQRKAATLQSAYWYSLLPL